ncbi:hypothetical protein H0H81_002530 [Sphagnurus paluster]|uniref:Uncharacterized protein n=1 Tax=Sphagnurus paluster TaxID=117069 RepID=A0A9P7K7M3_9AGAR|nr:hypothetical protein H0H81_002530 [Sphagnurus paluster]
MGKQQRSTVAQNITTILAETLFTLLYACIIPLPFLLESRLPPVISASASTRHALRVLACLSLIALGTKYLSTRRFRIPVDIIETLALLGALWMPPYDPVLEPIAHTNSDTGETADEPYEPYMALNRWVGSPGNGWVLSLLALVVAFAVQVLWTRVVVLVLGQPCKLRGRCNVKKGVGLEGDSRTSESLSRIKPKVE